MVHAAWHSCGSYQVNVSQIHAYKALGARAISVALMDVPSPPPPGGRWADYIAATKDLAADGRYYASPPRGALWTSRLLKDGWWPLIHGDQARWLIELAKLAPLPGGLETERIDLIHANHYFTLPLARRLRGAAKAPIICETQDIQARQYVLRNQGGFFVPPYTSYEDMLAVELDWTGQADLCVHLNEEEHREFGRLLPKARHALVYPAVAPVPLSEKGRGIVIVASDNYANFVSMRWFLNEVLPLAGDVAVSIYGNIDAGVKNRDRALYEAHRALFKGRVADLGAVYADAALYSAADRRRPRPVDQGGGGFVQRRAVDRDDSRLSRHGRRSRQARQCDAERRRARLRRRSSRDLGETTRRLFAARLRDQRHPAAIRRGF